jgi:hypothetical protein
VSWLLRQLQTAPENLKIEARIAFKSTSLAAPLSAVRDDAATLYPEGGRKIRGFTLVFDGRSWNIYTVHSDGSGLQPLADSGGDEIQPVWSPDGSLIAYMASSQGSGGIWDNTGTYDVYTSRPDGTGLTRVTMNAGGAGGSLTWQPLRDRGALHHPVSHLSRNDTLRLSVSGQRHQARTFSIKTQCVLYSPGISVVQSTWGLWAGPASGRRGAAFAGASRTQRPSQCPGLTPDGGGVWGGPLTPNRSSTSSGESWPRLPSGQWVVTRGGRRLPDGSWVQT